MVKRSISLRNIIILVFIILMFVTVGSIGYIVFSNWLSSADETISKIAEDMNMQIFSRIDTFVQSPLRINEVNKELIQNGVVDLTDEKERERFFVSVLKAAGNDIYSFSYGSEAGEYYGARRNEKGGIEIMRNNADTGGNSWYYSVSDEMTAGELAVKAGKFDPRTRDWYKSAVRAEGEIFSLPYKHFIMDDLAISAACPIYDSGGALTGVLGTHIILSNVDRFLKETVKDKNGFAIIIETQSGDFIANSLDIDNFTALADGTLKRFNISEIKNQAVFQASINYYSTGESHYKIPSPDGSMYLNIEKYEKNELNWTIISAIPVNMLMANITANIRLAFLLIILALLISVIVYYRLANRLLKPVDSLIQVTGRLSSGDLSQRAAIVRNDEIGRLSMAFNDMADTIDRLVHNLEEAVSERTADLKSANEALEEHKDRLRLILDSTAEAIYGIDLNGNCTFCNASCLKMLGYKDQSDLLGKNMHITIHHSYRDGTEMTKEECRVHQGFLDGIGTHSDDEVFWRADGTSFDVEYYSYPQYKDNRLIGAVVNFMDSTERRKNEEQIRYLSSHDSLTGLYNRRYYEDMLKIIDNENNLPISIIFGDINGLKLANDIFGHSAGDELIRKSAEVLKKACRAGDIIARVGGDEFIVILPSTGVGDAEKIMGRIGRELSREKVSAIKCSMALGCDTKEMAGQNIETVTENAENRMYTEKALNRKAFHMDTIDTLVTALHEKSPRERRHSLAICDLCEQIGRAMKLPETEVKKLKDTGFLHDIGKIVLSDNILNKDGGLTEEEQAEAQQHSVFGYRILNLFDDTVDLAEAVYCHHEKWDGSGYPKGLKGTEIPLPARIIAAAESYESLTGDRAPKAMSREEILGEIRKLSGKTLDPSIVEVLIDMIS